LKCFDYSTYVIINSFQVKYQCHAVNAAKDRAQLIVDCNTLRDKSIGNKISIKLDSI